MKKNPSGRRSRAASGLLCAIPLGAAVLTGTAHAVQRLTTASAVGRALTADTAQPGLSLTVSFVGVSGLSDKQLQSTAAQKKLLETLSLTIVEHTTNGKNLDQIKASTSSNSLATANADEDLDIRLHSDGTTPVELRTVGDTLYARAALPELLREFGEKPSVAAKAQQELNQANAELPGLSALGQGRWVSMDTKSILSAVPAQELPKQKASASEDKQLLAALKLALSDSANFTNLGDHGGRTEYQISISEKQFTTEFLGKLPTQLRQATAELGLTTQKLNQAEAKLKSAVVLDVWVSHDKANEIDLGFRQFSASVPGDVGLRVMIGSGGPVAAPTGAVKLNVAPLLKELLNRSQTD